MELEIFYEIHERQQLQLTNPRKSQVSIRCQLPPQIQGKLIIFASQWPTGKGVMKHTDSAIGMSCAFHGKNSMCGYFVLVLAVI